MIVRPPIRWPCARWPTRCAGSCLTCSAASSRRPPPGARRCWGRAWQAAVITSACWPSTGTSSRSRASRQQVLSSEGLDEPGSLAAQAATEVFLDHELARVKDRLRRQDLEPEGWRAASQVLGVTTWLTVSELQEVTDQLREIALRHADRFDDPGLRPAGAREARIFTVTSVAPRPPQPR